MPTLGFKIFLLHFEFGIEYKHSKFDSSMKLKLLHRFALAYKRSQSPSTFKTVTTGLVYVERMLEVI